jgi:hypothetical protein
MWQETSGTGSIAQSFIDKTKPAVAAGVRAAMQSASNDQNQWEATDAANTQDELQSSTEVQHSVLSERLQRLEARVSLHTSTNKQQQHQQQQHHHQQPQHHTADVASAALRQSLLLEERSLELGHRDMLLRRARDSIATLQSELESMRAAEHREHQARLELEHCTQERDAVQSELHATRRHSAEAAAALEAEVCVYILFEVHLFQNCSTTLCMLLCQDVLISFGCVRCTQERKPFCASRRGCNSNLSHAASARTIAAMPVYYTNQDSLLHCCEPALSGAEAAQRERAGGSSSTDCTAAGSSSTRC